MPNSSINAIWLIIIGLALLIGCESTTEKEKKKPEVQHIPIPAIKDYEVEDTMENYLDKRFNALTDSFVKNPTLKNLLVLEETGKKLDGWHSESFEYVVPIRLLKEKPIITVTLIRKHKSRFSTIKSFCCEVLGEEVDVKAFERKIKADPDKKNRKKNLQYIRSWCKY